MLFFSFCRDNGNFVIFFSSLEDNGNFGLFLRGVFYLIMTGSSEHNRRTFLRLGVRWIDRLVLVGRVMGLDFPG